MTMTGLMQQQAFGFVKVELIGPTLTKGHRPVHTLTPRPLKRLIHYTQSNYTPYSVHNKVK